MLEDLRLSIRGLAQARALSAAAVLCLALGIAGTTVVYSVTGALVLHPVPTPDATGLVMVTEIPPTTPSPDYSAMAPANYVDLVQRNRSFRDIAAFRGIDANLTGIDEPERVNGARVTPSYFRVLQAQPSLGRVFTDDDARYDESPDVVILSDGLWHRRFGADPDVVGRIVRINDVPRTVVGVMPAAFAFPAGAELWTPLSVSGKFGQDRDGRSIEGVLARLRPGVSLAAANADAHGIMSHLQREYPDYDAKWDMRVEWANDFYGQHPRPYVLAQLAAVLLVLLIACANVANLLLARATSRSREIAVRVALGAGRARIVRQQLAEALVLSLAGGAIGALLAVWGVAAFRTMLPAEQVAYNPGWTRMEVNGGVLAFTAAVSLLTAVIVAAAPAVAASRTDPQRALSDAGRSGSEGRGRHRLRGLLVMAEMALSLTMLAGTIVTVRGFAAMARENPGYRVDHALTMQLTAPIATYHTEADAERMYQRLVDRVRGEPGVKDAALTNGLPAEWSDFRARIFLEGEPRPTRAEPARSPRWRMVSPEYFATMDVPLVAGRLFTTHDDTLAPAVVVVSEAMARAYWPGQSPIGKRIGCACDDTTMITVIGVVADARFNPNAGAAVLPTYYVPTAQAHPWRTMTLVVRTVDDPAAMARRVGAAIASVAPTVAPGGVLTLDHLQQTALSPQRLTAEMMAVFAVVALLLAAVGIYGVTSYSVAQRTHDIGIRTALGARPGDIVRGVLGGALSMAGIGIVVGLVGAVAMTRALAHLLTDLSPGDPLSLAAAVLVLAAAAAVGSWLPARRAMRVDPAIALRRET